MFLRRLYEVKPRQWGPSSQVLRAVQKNSERLGLPMPVAFWPMWDGVGASAIELVSQACDIIGSYNGWCGDGLAFNSSQRIYAAACPISNPPFSLCAIVRPGNTADFRNILSVGNVAGTDYSSLNYDSTMHAVASSYDGSGSSYATAPAVHTAGTFYRLTAVFASNTSREIYSGGILQASNTVSRAVTESRIAIGISADSTPYGYFDGDILLASAYDVALTPAQVHRLYTEPYALLSPVSQRFIFDVGKSIASIHALVSSGITAGAPVLGAPLLGQAHALASSGITAGTPVLGAPTLGQVHALSSVGITAGAPVLGAPTIGQVHNLLSADVVSGQPVLGAPTLGQVHVLIANDIVAGAPVLGAPVVGSDTVNELVAEGITAGAPVLGAPLLGQIHALSANGITAEAPALGSPYIGQIHALTAEGITAGAPVLGAPTMSLVAHALVANGIILQAPTLGAPLLGQIHVLLANGIMLGAPVLGAPLVDYIAEETPAERIHAVPFFGRSYLVAESNRTYLVEGDLNNGRHVTQ